MRVGGRRHTTAALPPGMTRYPLYRRLGGIQGRSGRVRKISPLTGFRSPDRPVRSESLYRLRCPCPQCKIIQPLNYYFCGLSDDVSTSDCTQSNVTIIDELEGISKETVVAECGYYRGICQKNVSEIIKKKTPLG
jgi:hypothetical protein